MDDVVGSKDLALPDELRPELRAHLQDLRDAYRRRGWAGRVGFGSRPAVLVIDLAIFWLDPAQQIGSRLDQVVESVGAILQAARTAQVPIFFTTYAHDPARQRTSPRLAGRDPDRAKSRVGLFLRRSPDRDCFTGRDRDQDGGHQAGMGFPQDAV